MNRHQAKVDPAIVESSHPDNIVAKWHEATPEEKSQGKRWYTDAHLVATAIAHGDSAKGAGIVANYSPQTPWPQNLHNAARVLHENRGIGGPGEGMMASTHQKDAAQRILNGEHHSEVLKNQKTSAFAHLIEHGGDHPGDDPKRVCVDRHALSVAVGHRVSDAEYDGAGLNTKARYGKVAEHYRLAAKTISDHEGEHISPHQVQSVTWSVQQRQNQDEDHIRAESASLDDRGSRGRNVGWSNSVDRWQHHVDTHHPDIKGKAPTAFASLHTVGYGEVKAPMAVDTLREDNCPVCGEHDAYDGDQCQVCGFVTPPEMFRDPDLDKAKLLDLRNGNPATGDPNGQGDPNGIQHDLPPVDPEAIDEEGNPGAVEGEDAGQQTDEDGQVNVETRSLGDTPVDPDDLDEEGSPVDPEAATGRVNQGGEPFTPGPNAPEPETPAEPGDQVEGAEDEQNEADEVDAEQAEDQNASGEADDGQEVTSEENAGQPGTAGDGSPDLLCPACGFEADAAQPMSTPGNVNDPANAGNGAQAGDMCPQCGDATLMSFGEIEQMTQAQQGAPA